MEFLGVLFMLIGMLLLLNAVWLQGKVDSVDIGYLNLLVGGLAVGLSVYIAFTADPAISGHFSAAVLLFGITYLWVGVNCLRGAEDQRALGGYCLLVALLCLPFAYKTFGMGDTLFTVEWLAFGFTWYLFYQLLYAGNASVMKPLVGMVYVVGASAGFTGWSMLYGYWPYI